MFKQNDKSLLEFKKSTYNPCIYLYTKDSAVYLNGKAKENEEG